MEEAGALDVQLGDQFVSLAAQGVGFRGVALKIACFGASWEPFS